MNTTNIKSFDYLEDGNVTFSIVESIKTSKFLDSGSYMVDFEAHPSYSVQVCKNPDIEDVKSFNYLDKESIDKLIHSFFSEDLHKTINELGFAHKLGLLYYGKEGSGKTTVIKDYCNMAIQKYNTIVFHMKRKDDYLTSCWEFVKKIRNIQTNPIIIVLDEIDSFLLNNNESTLKTIIDGNDSIDNVMFLASTNYIDKIPNALKQRPSRFKHVIEINAITDKNNIFTIVSNLLKNVKTKDEIINICESINNKTLDEIKQICLDILMDIENYSFSKKRIGFIV